MCTPTQSPLCSLSQKGNFPAPNPNSPPCSCHHLPIDRPPVHNNTCGVCHHPPHPPHPIPPPPTHPPYPAAARALAVSSGQEAAFLTALGRESGLTSALRGCLSDQKVADCASQGRWRDGAATCLVCCCIGECECCNTAR